MQPTERDIEILRKARTGIVTSLGNGRFGVKVAPGIYRITKA